MKPLVNLLVSVLLAAALLPGEARAGDGATIIFRSGQVAFIDNGYDKLIGEMKRLNVKSVDHRIVELTIAGGTFLINVAEVVVVCRDRCTSMEIIDVRDPKRAGSG